MSTARILVAEDNEDNAEILREYLQALGYSVAFAPDGNRAIDMGASGDYDLIILDVHMPLYDGTEVLRMLRARHRLRPVKVIALTADPLPQTRQELERAGLDGFLAKPVDLNELQAEIVRVLGEG
ncbi:MAG: response regulator [Chloroflexi bacterium]|nr:MAG: response regulator [Chloroflexota bacterium]